MKDQLNALYELQKLDVEIARASMGLEALTGALALRKQHAAAKKERDAAEKVAADSEIELMDSELKLKSIDEKRTATEKRLYGGTVSNPKELSSLEKEIEHLKNQQGQLDGRVLELYEQVETLRETAKSVNAIFEEIEKQARAALGKEATERKRLEAELARLEPERADMAAKITDKHLLSRYDAIRKKSGGTGMAKIVDHRCEGCHVAVTNFTIRNIFEDKGIEYCENCGRILTQDF